MCFCFSAAGRSPAAPTAKKKKGGISFFLRKTNRRGRQTSWRPLWRELMSLAGPKGRNNSRRLLMWLSPSRSSRGGKKPLPPAERASRRQPVRPISRHFNRFPGRPGEMRCQSGCTCIFQTKRGRDQRPHWRKAVVRGRKMRRLTPKK